MNGLVGSVEKSLGLLGLDGTSTILAAVSGGPDSTALLRALIELRGRAIGELSACIVDHGIRPRAEIDDDIRFVTTLCLRFGVPCFVKIISPGRCEAVASETHRGMEETARIMRHELLREAAREAGAGWIALGHTEDDSIETLLMRVLQGSDIQGLAGIPARRDIFVRPLLECTRARIEAYLRSLGQPWMNDSTNTDTRYLRNMIRHTLVPVLEKGFPGYRTGLLSLKEKLTLAADLVAEQESLLRWESTELGYSIEARAFLAAAPSVRARSLLTLWDRMQSGSSGSRRLPWRFLAPILTRMDLPISGVVLQGHEMVLRTLSGRLLWETDIASRCKIGYFILVSEARSVALRGTGKRVTVSRCVRCGREDNSRGGISIPVDEVRLPLVLRSIRKGDVIFLEAGAVSVADMLAGWKVPRSQRDVIPIMADKKGVLAVLGGALGYRNRARAGMDATRGAAVDRILIDIENDMEEGCEQQQR